MAYTACKLFSFLPTTDYYYFYPQLHASPPLQGEIQVDST
jgi:hypothetical protein